jgi:hypothetical protein
VAAKPLLAFFLSSGFPVGFSSIMIFIMVMMSFDFFMMGVPFLVDETPILHGEIGTFWLLEMCQNPQSS